jgi:hypothetical protein
MPGAAEVVATAVVPRAVAVVAAKWAAQPEAAAGVAPADARLAAVVAERAAQPAAEEAAALADAPRAAVAEGAAQLEAVVAEVVAVLPLEAVQGAAEAAVAPRREAAAGRVLRPAAARPSGAASRPSSVDRVAGSARRRTYLGRRRHGPASRFAPAARSSRSPSLPAGQYQFASSESIPGLQANELSRYRKIDWRQLIPSRSSIKV